MIKRQSLTLAILSIFILMMSSVASAQVDDCFGLSADDCEVINEASFNGLDGAEAFTLDIAIDFEAADIPDEGLSATTFTMNGAIDFIEDDSEVGLALAGTLDLTASLNGETTLESTLDIAMVDDIAYFQTDGEGWQSVDVIALLEDESFEAQLDGLGLGDDAMADDAMADLGVDPMALFALFEILELPGLLNYERAGDDFVFTVDFSALQALLEEENEELLDNLIEVIAGIEPTAAFFVPAIPALIDTGTITITQTVNPDLNIIDFIGFDVDVEAQLAALLTGDAEAPATTVFLDVDLGVGNLDDVDDVVAPEDAEDITEELLGMLGMALPQ